MYIYNIYILKIEEALSTMSLTSPIYHTYEICSSLYCRRRPTTVEHENAVPEGYRSDPGDASTSGF